MIKNLIRSLKCLTLAIFLFCIYILLIFNKVNDSIINHDLINNNSFKKIFNDEINVINNNIEKILDEHCDPRNIRNSYTCLAKVHEYEINLNRKQKIKCERCLIYSKETKTYEKNLIYHHTFWQINQNTNVEGYQKRVLYLNLMSYLVTQNLCCTKFIFWKLKQFPKNLENQIRKKFKYHIDNGVIMIKNFDLSDVCNTKAFYNHSICSNENSYLKEALSERKLIELSDFVRFFALDQYGGIYTDGDVLYLRDMQSLWFMNFAYRWGQIDYFNTAIIGSSKTKSSSDLYTSIVSSWKTLNDLISRFEPHEITESVKKINNGSMYNYKNLKMLHSALFDSAWLCHENVIGILNSNSICRFSDFAAKKFQNLNKDNFLPDIIFPGAFTLHLHLKDCCSVVVENSYMDLLENHYRKLLLNDIKL